MNELIDTTEMYLRTIYELGEEGVPPLRARIAERLQQSGPTVSQTVARMERDGLVTLHADRQLVLTDKGRKLAARVMRRHRLAECLLVDVIGLDWALVHEEACRWEHVISTDVERRLVTLLHNPTHCPYGNPIPALAELGAPEPEDSFLDGVRALSAALPDDGWHAVCLRRMGEAIQTQPEALAKLAGIGLRPGADAEAALSGDTLAMRTASGSVELPGALADHLFVT
jgi:DtxR family Mn-dependent transcriptional regulator